MGLQKNKMFRESLEQRAAEWGVSDAVQFDGFAHDVEKEIKEADIVLNFSESESFSFTCLEALYFGTPLIASDSGGPTELFEHRRSGYLVRNGDVDAMAEAILYLSQNPNFRKCYSRNSRAYVRSKFNLNQTVEGLRKVYHGFIQNE
jgi:glycosyltransferase involved in cell wall biosynthesis